MRIIARKRLREYQRLYPEAAAQLDAWYHDVRRADWATSADIKDVYGRRASLLPDHRVVFDIKGGNYRLIVWVQYAYRKVFVRWFGPHQAYDKINATTV